MELWRVRSWPLSLQVLGLLFIASVLPVIVAVAISSYQARQLAERNVADLLAARAEQVATELDAHHRTQRSALHRFSLRPIVVERLSGAAVDAEELRETFDAFTDTDPNLRYIALLDPRGQLVAASSEHAAKRHQDTEYFQRALAGKPAIAGPFVPGAEEVPLLAYAQPVRGQDEQLIGVAVFFVRVTSLWESVRASNGRAGEGSYAVVLNRQGVRIAHSARDDLVFRAAGRLPKAELDELVRRGDYGERTEYLLTEDASAPHEFALSRAAWSPRSEVVTKRFVPTSGTNNLAVARRLSFVDWTVFVLVPELAVYAPIQSLLVSSLLVAVAIAALAVGAGTLVSRGILQPVRRLMSAAERVAQGDLSVRVAEPGSRDLGGLARRFNDMTSSIEESRRMLEQRVEERTRELRQANQELQTQREELLAQRRELENQRHELEQQNVAVERADRLKSEFLANMSHELRTPLNSIIGFSELVLLENSKGQLPDRHLQYLKDVLSSGRHLLALINDILDLSKIEAGRLTINPTPLYPQEAIAEACAVIMPTAQAKSMTLLQSIESDAQVLADPGRLRQVLLNLLSNALKFGPRGSNVEIATRLLDRVVEFRVSDQGPGVDPSIGDALFQPFVQGESALVKSHQGTGLGLAISKRLVEQHGGKLTVESVPGRGATFRFTIPVAVSAPTSRETLAQTPVAPRTGNARVLVIDDDPAVTIILKDALESEGYIVESALTGEEGIARATERAPDVIVVDMRLPDQSGIEVIETLARRPETRSCPIVVLTAFDLSADEEKRLRERVQCIAHKGDLLRSELIAAIERLTSPPSAPTQDRPLVLVVDDHDMNRELARSILLRRGINVETANDGESGVELARRVLPDLVLMDLSMPKKDGFQATRELKTDPLTRSIPVVALTALAMRGDEEKARAAGIDAYLTKPVDREALERLLEQYLHIA